MAYEVARVFTKRETEKSAWSGRVGSATLFVSDDGIWTLDGKVLGRKSIEYLMNFSLQSLQDAYAGADDLAEAQGNWEKKRTALIDGTIGSRESNGMTEFDRIGHAMIAAAIKEKTGEKPTAETVAEKFELNRDKLEAAINAEIERREAARKAKAKVADKIGELDL